MGRRRNVCDPVRVRCASLVEPGSALRAARRLSSCGLDRGQTSILDALIPKVDMQVAHRDIESPRATGLDRRVGMVGTR